MPLYDYRCPMCGKEETKVVLGDGVIIPDCCGFPMQRLYSPPLIRIKGQGYPSRRKWMDNWTPESQPFQVGSLHGEKY